MSSIMRREIHFSKITLIFSTLGCLIFMGFGYLLIFLGNIPDVEAKPELIAKIIGWCFIGGFGIGLFANLKKLLTPRVGLIIDEKGINDQTYGYSVGLIEWKDIQAIEELKIRLHLLPVRILLIKVMGPQKYIERAPSSVTHKILQSNQLFYKTPISITSAPLKCNFNELRSWIITTWEMSKN